MAANGVSALALAAREGRLRCGLAAQDREVPLVVLETGVRGRVRLLVGRRSTIDLCNGGRRLACRHGDAADIIDDVRHVLHGPRIRHGPRAGRCRNRGLCLKASHHNGELVAQAASIGASTIHVIRREAFEARDARRQGTPTYCISMVFL